MTVFNIETLSSKQFSELNRRLEPYFLGASGHNVAEMDAEPKWDVSMVATDRLRTVQTLNAISKTLAQAVTVAYYTIDELPDDVQRRLIQQAIDNNVYWDDWKHEREKSFNTICDALGLTWGRYAGQWGDNSIWVELQSDYTDDKYVEGASRVIAYIVNRWDFTAPAYTKNEKLRALRKKWTLAKSHTETNAPTGYCADYCLLEAYTSFLALARKKPDMVTLQTFCKLLAHEFQCEEDGDYEHATSDEYAKEFLLADQYFTWDGTNITYIVTHL